MLVTKHTRHMVYASTHTYICTHTHVCVRLCEPTYLCTRVCVRQSVCLSYISYSDELTSTHRTDMYSAQVIGALSCKSSPQLMHTLWCSGTHHDKESQQFCEWGNNFGTPCLSPKHFRHNAQFYGTELAILTVDPCSTYKLGVV